MFSRINGREKKDKQKFELPKFNNNTKMKEKYFFCFKFNSITLQNDIQSNLEAASTFQIQIVKNQKSMGYTNPIPCDPNIEGVINIDNSCLVFTTIYWETCPEEKSKCEIRLFEIIPGGDKPIGSYEFQLSNYIEASKTLFRSCVEMKVEIGFDFIIEYVVYLQSTRQALQKIVKEHQTAKQLHMMAEWGSEEEEFLPEEIRNADLQDNVKIIRYDMESPLILKKRFWSPTRLRSKRSLISQEQSQLNSPRGNLQKIMRSDQKQKKRGKTYLKIKKNSSIISENTSNTLIKSRFACKEKKLNQVIENEVEQLTRNDEDLMKDNKKLYEVVIHNSKVTLSPAGSDDEQDQNVRATPQQLHSSSHFINNEQTKKSLKIVFFFMCCLLILLVYLSLKNEDFDSLKQSQRRKSKKKKKTKRF